MERPVTSLAAVLVGVGIGAVGGAYLGAAAILPGIVAAVVGVGLSSFGSQPATLGAPAPVESPSERPTLAGLGTRVEQILRLAESQANDHRAEARREAESILSEARSEARLILDRARAEAAELPGVSKPEVDPSAS